MLLLLSSLWCAPGGIPAFNRLLVQAAAEHAAAAGQPLRIVVLADARDAQPDPAWLAALPAAARGALAAGGYVPCGGSRGRCVGEVARVLARKPAGARPIVCIGHVNLAPLGLLAQAAGWGAGVVAHGTEVWTPLPWLRRVALRRADAVACVSEHTARKVAGVQGVAPARCVRVINALAQLPPESKEPPDSPAAAAPFDGGLHVLSITRLHPGEPKGIDLVLRALVSLPALRYTVIGEGEALPALRALAARLGVAGRVRFRGALPDAARDAELAACDVLALPSRGEGFGIVYLEAMAHGKPCLAARAGGAPEVVLDGETGLVVDADADAVRDGLARLCDPVLRARLGAAGRERVARSFCYAQFRAHALRFFARLEERPAAEEER